MAPSTKLTTPDSSVALPDSLLDAVAPILADERPLGFGPALGEATASRDIFAVEQRKAWDKSSEARCDFRSHPRLTHRAGVWFLSLWQKSLMGRTLSDIKSDPAEIPHFAVAVSDFLSDMLGSCLASANWALCTTPKRRHKERNFASLISTAIHKRIQLPFYEDVAICRSRQRVNAVFALNILPEEPNIIVFDDFVTTGSTLRAMKNLLSQYNKNLLFVAGINNSL